MHVDEIEDPSVAAYVNWLDYSAIGVYFLLVIGIGFWSSKVSNKETVDGYFLGGRKMHWIPVGLSLFASNVGSEHFVGLSGTGASSGVGITAFEYSGAFLLLILGWFFMPVFMSSNISTMPEYLKKRFGGERIRIYLSVLALILYIFTKISASLFAGALFIKLLLNIDNIYYSAIILVLVSALFTMFGGLTAVIWTDFMQMVLMIGGALSLTIMGLVKVGGYSKLMDNYRTAGLPTGIAYQAYKDGCNASLFDNCTSCSEITPYYKNLFRPMTDSELPWPGLFGVLISGAWYWCTDQVIVQRALSAKNLSHVKASCILAGALKFLPIYLIVLPGMMARVLWPNQIGCSNPDYCEKVCGSRVGCTNLAYPYMVIKLMPRGATGLMLSVILAALMSSLSSIFNSASTIFIIDIYTRFRKTAGEIEQIIVGRFFVAVLVVISILWLPIIQNTHNSQLFQYIQSVTAYLAPPPCAIYILALFWPRTTEPAAFWSLLIGLFIGMFRFAMEYIYQGPECGSNDPDHSLPFISKVHYLHFGIILFVISMAIGIIVSLSTRKIEAKHLYRLTYQTRFSEQVREDLDGEEEDDKVKPMSSVNKFVLTICCAERSYMQETDKSISNAVKLSPEESAKHDAALAKEDERYSTLISLGALAVTIVCAFFWGFYA